MSNTDTWSEIMAALAKDKKERPYWPEQIVSQAAAVNGPANTMLARAMGMYKGGADLEAMKKDAIQTIAVAIRFLMENS